MREHIERALREREEASKLPTITVTFMEFGLLAQAAGWSTDKAAFQATVCRMMGSAVRIGEQLVRIGEASA